MQLKDFLKNKGEKNTIALSELITVGKILIK